MKTPQSTQSVNLSSEIVNRLKQELGLKFDREFAALLGIEPTLLANWKSRDSLSKETVLKAMPAIDPQWLLSMDVHVIRKSPPFLVNGDSEARPGTMSELETRLATFSSVSQGPVGELALIVQQASQLSMELRHAANQTPVTYAHHDLELLRSIQEWLNKKVAAMEAAPASDF